MENDLLQCKDPFPKAIVGACRVLAGWKNKYVTRDNKMSNANAGVSFTIKSEEQNDKKNKKETTCFKCKNTGHYANECDEK